MTITLTEYLCRISAAWITLQSSVHVHCLLTVSTHRREADTQQQSRQSITVGHAQRDRDAAIPGLLAEQDSVNWFKPRMT